MDVYKPYSSTADYALEITTQTSINPLPLTSSLRFNGTSIDGSSSLGGGSIYLNPNSTGNVVLANGGGNVGIGTGSPSAKLHVVGTAKVQVLEITGADLAEKFPASETAEPGMVVAIDPDHPGELCLSRGAYNRRVAGVISGANNLPTGAILGNLPDQKETLPVALSGRVWTWCDATEQPIGPGDLLTTAAKPGHAMKVTDYPKAQGAIIGKAMTSLASGRGLVLVLVTLQ